MVVSGVPWGRTDVEGRKKRSSPGPYRASVRRCWNVTTISHDEFPREGLEGLRLQHRVTYQLAREPG